MSKDSYVRPFAQELDRRRISYWLDEAEILWGDKISAKINEGLKLSNFVVVFLSDGFVGRNWTEAELASAINRENSEGRTVVLPVIIGETKELLKHYPLLRDKSYLQWNIGIAAIADELQKLTDRRWSKPELDQFILDKVDLQQFAKKEDDIWGAGYRLLTNRIQFDEGYYFFWNEKENTIEKYWIDAVRSHDKEPLTDNDIEFVRSIVIKCTKRIGY